MAETVVALSSGPLPSGVAVIRVSGPSSSTIVEALAGDLPSPRHAVLRVLRDPANEIIDRGLVLWFPGPGSFTGEDVAEFHVHGSRAVVDRLLDVATSFDGVRLAEAGEFARRAFGNGKLDFVEAEALGDLIGAETEAQRRFAIEQSGGVQSNLYEGWRQRLVDGRALVEAEIDFVDEEDVPGSVSDRVWSDIRSMIDEIDMHVTAERRGRIMRSGFEVVLAGAPNAGKSTLLNSLAGSERAIVSAEPGTTRDIVEARLDLGGYLVVVADTAGVRAGAGGVEQLGIDRGLARAATADLVLHLDDAGVFPVLPIEGDAMVWRVRTKADIDGALGTQDVEHAVSAMRGDGMDALVSAIELEAGRQGGFEEIVAPGRARHVAELRRCRDHLFDSASERIPLELRAESLRLAADSLGRITGRVDVEEILGSIFSQFCVGK